MTGESTKTIPIVLYADLFEKDWDTLPPDAQNALSQFLEKLQRDPDSPEVLRKSQSHGKYFAYQFHGGYVAYWTIKRGSDSRPERIELLEIAQRRECHVETEQQSENQSFVARVVSALLRLAAIAVFLLAHRALNTALAYAIPSAMSGALTVAQHVILAVFSMIYVYLAADMVYTFTRPLWTTMLPNRESKLSGREAGDTS
jgi:mRNA-degrading endonuclease RelE of RelBE toxin-antitoxin system